jgi:hypothetical protein
MSVKFFLFGCWNRQGCKDNTDLKTLIEKIKENKDHYEAGLLLGDNIYGDKYGVPRTDMKNKIHNINVLEDGFKCINDIGKKIYSVLGNHDINTCEILTKELSNKWSNIYMPTNCYTEIIEKNGLKIKIVVIDTNHFDNEYKNKEMINCPIIQDEKFYNEEKMENFIIKELNDTTNYDWILLCGHVPIAGFKDKSGKKYIKIDEIPYNSLKKHIMNSPNKNKIIYLCADIHNYQYNILKYNIIKIDGVESYELPHIIAGTGGAPPDYFLEKKCELNMKEVTMDNNDIIINKESHHSFGFVELELTKDNYKPKYNYIGNQEYNNVFKATGKTTFGYKKLMYSDKYYKKYIKYKNKYIKLKNILNL